MRNYVEIHFLHFFISELPAYNLEKNALRAILCRYFHLEIAFDEFDCICFNNSICHISRFLEFTCQKISYEFAVLCGDLFHGINNVASCVVLDAGAGGRAAGVFLDISVWFCMQ